MRTALIAFFSSILFLLSSCSGTQSIQANNDLSDSERRELGLSNVKPDCDIYDKRTGKCTRYEYINKSKKIRNYYLSVRGMSRVSNIESESFVPDRVFFRFDSTGLASHYRDDISKIVEHYTRNERSKKIVLTGYCDERGSIEYNYALGERRANAVKRALVGRGIDASKIVVRSMGKQKSAVARHNYPENRVVTFEFSGR